MWRFIPEFPFIVFDPTPLAATPQPPLSLSTRAFQLGTFLQVRQHPKADDALTIAGDASKMEEQVRRLTEEVATLRRTLAEIQRNESEDADRAEAKERALEIAIAEGAAVPIEPFLARRDAVRRFRADGGAA